MHHTVSLLWRLNDPRRLISTVLGYRQRRSNSTQICGEQAPCKAMKLGPKSILIVNKLRTQLVIHAMEALLKCGAVPLSVTHNPR
jgi:hypothetical protein